MRQRLVIALLILSVFVIVMYLVLSVQRNVPFGRDAWAYYGAARAVAVGTSPYAAPPVSFIAPPYLYPPLLAVLLAPLALLPLDTLAIVWLTIVISSLLLLIPLLRPLVGWRVACLGVVCFLPTWQTFYEGQINGIIAVLLALAVVSLQRNLHGRAGAFLALGVLLKVTPIISLMVLHQRRQWKILGSAAMTMGSVVMLTLPVLGAQAWFEGSLAAVQSGRADAGLHSLTSIAYAVSGMTNVIPMLVVAVPVLLLTLWRSPHVPLPLALAAGMLVPLLIARVVWDHHAVMILPALALMWSWDERTRLLSVGTWFALNFLGSFVIPLVLTVCWLICLWPDVLTHWTRVRAYLPVDRFTMTS